MLRASGVEGEAVVGFRRGGEGRDGADDGSGFSIIRTTILRETQGKYSAMGERSSDMVYLYIPLSLVYLLHVSLSL